MCGVDEPEHPAPTRATAKITAGMRGRGIARLLARLSWPRACGSCHSVGYVTGRGRASMRVPLTVNDFLERAELVYGERVGVVDEPDQPAESWGANTWREIASRARAQAAGLDALGIGAGERIADRVAQLGAAVHLAVRCERFGPGARADQLPAQRRGDRLHRRALGRVDAARRSRARRRSAERAGEAPHGARRRVRRGALPLRRRARAVARARRGRDRDDQLHERHDRAPEGRADDAPQHLGQRHDVRLAGRRCATATCTSTRCRCSTATGGA